MCRHEPCGLDEHAARTARGAEDAPVIRLDNLGEEADDAAGRVELAAAWALAHGELAEKVFVDAPEGVVVHRGGNFGDFLEQFLEEGAGEEVVGFGPDAGGLRGVRFDVAHGGIDLGADILGFGTVEQVIEPRLGGQVEYALGVIGDRVIHARTAPGGHTGLLQVGAPGGEADFGKAQKDEAEDGRGVFLGFEAGVGAELVSGVPKALFQRGVVGVLLRWCDPDHAFPVSLWMMAWARKLSPSPGWWQMPMIIAIPRVM